MQPTIHQQHRKNVLRVLVYFFLSGILLGGGNLLYDKRILSTIEQHNIASQGDIVAVLERHILFSEIVNIGGIVIFLLLTTYGVLRITTMFREHIRQHNAILKKKKIYQVEGEDLRKALQQAQTANLLKEQFVANMSHEIRTPLNAIIGFSGLLHKTQLEDNQQEFVRCIESSGENLLHIINEILDFSKIEAGVLRLEQIPFSLTHLLHSLENLFRYKAEEKQLNFQVSLDPTLPEDLKGDPTRLTQILVNLLGNAFKFTAQGSIRLAVKPVARTDKSVHIQFEVTDTGIGISTDQLEQIFERFQQVSASTTRAYGGTGLGLHIARQLTHLQQGTLQVASTEGAGSIFTVEIPYQITESMEGLDTDMSLSQQIRKNRILIVEDNPMNQRVVELLLDNWGLQHETAANGKVALDLLNRKVYDLILMDIQMPEMDGYTTTQYIRQKMHLQTPIIATTAHAFAGEREKCIGYGMNDYISKPVREAELLVLIQRYAHIRNKWSIKHPTEPVTDYPGFNRAYIAEISRNQPAQLQEMAQLFIKQSQKEIDQLTQAVEQHNFGVATRLAHSMKSTVNYMGFETSLGQQLTALELLTQDTTPQPELIITAVSTLQNELQVAYRFVEQAFIK